VLIDHTFSATIKSSVRFVAFFLLMGLATASDETPTLLFLGDSLTAGYGLDPEEAYPALIEDALNADGIEVNVINGGLSGETSAGGLRRLRWVLRRPVELLVIALGANDSLRGLPPEDTQKNLEGMIEAAREIQPEIRILLAGMYAPPNMGAAYRERFDLIYTELAKSHAVELVPFLLEGVAGEPSLNQADGIHPNVEGQKRVAQNLLGPIITLIKGA
jgi:acyl-CoA thioesterase-1